MVQINFINEGGVFYMIVDSKKETIKINCSQIDQFSENKNGNLVLIYYMPV